MPRYFFDYICGHETMPDDEGVELPSPSEIPGAAFKALPEMLKDLPRRAPQTASISVRDETGRLVFITTIFLSARWERLSPDL